MPVSLAARQERASTSIKVEDRMQKTQDRRQNAQSDDDSCLLANKWINKLNKVLIKGIHKLEEGRILGNGNKVI